MSDLQRMQAERSQYYQSQAQAQGIGLSPSVPRELRILERADGLQAGLAELVNKLESLQQKVLSAPDPKGLEVQAPPPCDLTDAIARSEGRLRYAHELLDALHARF